MHAGWQGRTFDKMPVRHAAVAVLLLHVLALGYGSVELDYSWSARTLKQSEPANFFSSFRLERRWPLECHDQHAANAVFSC
jgi:hypothetical protein